MTGLPPFAFGTFLAETFSETRRRDADQICTYFLNNRPVAVIAEPGMGRSDLVHNLASELLTDDEILLEVSAAKCFDPADFFEHLINQLIQAVSATNEEFSLLSDSLLREVNHSTVLDAQENSSIKLDRAKWAHHILYLANLAEIIADKFKRSMVVVVYDVEHLAAFDNGLDTLRILLDAFNAGRRIRFIMTGTDTADMKAAEPLILNCCHIVRLGKIPEEEWVQFIESTFSKHSKKIKADAAAMIVRAVNGLSAYVIELAWHTWIATANDVGQKELYTGLEMLMNSYGPKFIVLLRDMPEEVRYMLISLVLGKRVSASKASIRSLSSLGLIKVINGRPMLHDPVLAKWILTRYLPAKSAGKPIF